MSLAANRSATPSVGSSGGEPFVTTSGGSAARRERPPAPALPAARPKLAQPALPTAPRCRSASESWPPTPTRAADARTVAGLLQRWNAAHEVGPRAARERNARRAAQPAVLTGQAQPRAGA